MQSKNYQQFPKIKTGFQILFKKKIPTNPNPKPQYSIPIQKKVHILGQIRDVEMAGLFILVN